MSRTPSKSYRGLACWSAGIALLLGLATDAPAARLAAEGGVAVPKIAAAGATTIGFAPGFAGQVHRLMHRTDRAFSHLGTLARRIGAVWLWVVPSALVFFLVVGFSSVADFRMLDFRRNGLTALVRMLVRGVRLFFRMLTDRGTPFLARAVVVLCLLYWLLPVDLIPDESVLPGFVDDLIVAVLAAKGFVHLCPDALVARHAAALQARP